jgi:pilus assembly protein Flp/PilA
LAVTWANCTVKMRLHRILAKITKVAGCEAGTSAIEYGLIMGLIVLLVMISIENLAGATASMWNDISTKSSTAMTSN